MPLWCVPCFGSFRQHTQATRKHDEDPMCQACAIRLGFEEKPETEPTRSQDLESATAGEARAGVSSASPATGFSVVPDASPGSFTRAISKAFRHKPRGLESAVNDVPKEEKETTMSLKVEIDWSRYDALEAKGLSQSAIARELGILPGTLSYKVKHRGKAKPKKTKSGSVSKRANGGASAEESTSGNVKLDLPESAIDRFLLKLPVERKSEIFTAELAR
jgi:hypothetical protein